ncbi:MAG: lipid II:glycine glycyltransferase FemX [Syntrophobacteraceae bacterium]
MFLPVHCSPLTLHSCLCLLTAHRSLLTALTMFFHSSNWENALEDAYSYKPVHLPSPAGSPLARIPLMEVDSPLTGKRGVSLPFTDYCEPIAPDKGCFLKLLDDILSHGSQAGWKYLELRGGARFFDGTVPYRTYLRHILKIHDDDKKLFNAAKPGTRQNIRKAAHSGVRVVISRSRRELDDYYRLHCLTRKRHGVPPQPKSFFNALHRHIISKGMGFTALGIRQGRAIAGAVYFHSGKKGIYKYGASDPEHLPLRANNLVMWEAIRWFSRNGFDELCFGRTEPDNTGLLRFKKSWGPREEALPYYRYDFHRAAFIQATPATAPGSALLRRLPIPLLRLAGLLLYKHAG